jgi:hypothetical protein
MSGPTASAGWMVDIVPPKTKSLVKAKQFVLTSLNASVLLAFPKHTIS